MSFVSRHPLEAPLPEPATNLPEPGWPERLAARVLQLGAIAAVVTVATNRYYELDRFFVPKELVLHLTALLAGLLALRAARRTGFDRVDWLLLIYLGLGVLSGLFATNWWLAGRSLAVTASGIVLYWSARALAGTGLRGRILAGLAFAVVVGAATSLLQTYGIESQLFSSNRAPGGTLGNRNFIAHLAAFGYPLVLLGALNASRFWRYLLAATGTGVVLAVLVLTRSRAAWLAFAGATLVLFAALVISPALRTHGRTWARLAGVLLLAAGAIAGAIYAPNSLRWNSDNPYLESMRSVANFQEGSGRGRLVQYRQSMRMTLHHPALGVGPGNWGVEYPDHAARNDRSLSNANPGMTTNPWPSSDWIAFVSERGPLAALVLTLAILGIAVGALARLIAAREPGEALRDAALLAVLVAAAIAGTFDAVLLLALPALIVWTAAGALSGAPAEEFAPPPRRRLAPALAVVALLAGVGAARSGAQVAAMTIHGSTYRLESLVTAARIDPGNYRLRVQLARRGSGLNAARRCEHARAAHALYPNAATAARLARGCR